MGGGGLFLRRRTEPLALFNVDGRGAVAHREDDLALVLRAQLEARPEGQLAGRCDREPLFVEEYVSDARPEGQLPSGERRRRQ